MGNEWLINILLFIKGISFITLYCGAVLPMLAMGLMGKKLRDKPLITIILIALLSPITVAICVLIPEVRSKLLDE